MLNISMDKTHFTVKLDGHAGYAPVGADIVCAGASMLAATLARALGGVAGYHYADDGNMMEVSCTPTAAQLGVPRLVAVVHQHHGAHQVPPVTGDRHALGTRFHQRVPRIAAVYRLHPFQQPDLRRGHVAPLQRRRVDGHKALYSRRR